MKNLLYSTRIRTRLLVAYVGILIVGFAVLTVVAGGQISSAARADYEQRLSNEIRLIAQGINTYFRDSTTFSLAEELEQFIEDYNRFIEDYEAQVGGTLTIYQEAGGFRFPMFRPSVRGMPEIEAASRGVIIIIDRKDESGEDRLFTAAPVLTSRDSQYYVQLSVPEENLQTLVLQRWAVLWIIFAVVTALALIATVFISRTIIQPLHALRDSALQLSQGDFSHRVAYSGKDEIAEVAKAFNEMAHQVESMLEEQRAFASNTSHELRTPLTTIRLRSEALRFDEQLDSETSKRYIEEIDSEVTRLSALIEDLTLLSRLDTGRAELGDIQIDVGRFAASLQQQMLPQAQAKNINLQLDVTDEASPIMAGLNHLTVVFRNLLDNAIKYTPEGGSITWRIRPGEEGLLSIIQDTGQGIEPDHLPHLFERFYRADRARSRDVAGTGLGLALVKSIVDNYGGRIRIESEGSGKGTTARVFWPYHGQTQ